MRTIAIINQKGGCGKTTVAINLASVLAERGRRTLLVDVDPQAHCALGLAVPEQQVDRSIRDLLLAGLNGTIDFCDVTWQISRNLDLVPSTMALAGIEQELANAPDKDRRLAQVLSTVADQYDFCVIDCPPAIGLLTFNALRAADEVIIPVETGYFALQGSIKQKATVEMLARRAAHRVRFEVLATMYDVRTKLAREILSELRKNFDDKLLPVVVHFNSKLKEAASFGQAITEYDPASRGHQDFEKLVDWLIANPPLPAASPPAEACEDGTAGEAGAAAGPAMSRAAELVERARVLSQRTAALAARLASDPDVAAAERAWRGGTVLGAGDGAQCDPNDTATDSAGNGNANALQHRRLDAALRPAVNTRVRRAFGVRCTGQGVLFVQPAGKACQLFVAGDFNQWSKTSTPLKFDQALGVWQTLVPIPPGRYRYRLVADGQWLQDPYNTYVESNPFGELNNVVEVDEVGALA